MIREYDPAQGECAEGESPWTERPVEEGREQQPGERETRAAPHGAQPVQTPVPVPLAASSRVAGEDPEDEH